MLLLLNGPPAVGKTTVAGRYAAGRPLALHVDVDALRMAIGGWREREEPKLLARQLALAMAARHLAAGHDVVVSQYLGRVDFVEALEAVAAEAGTPFVEVVLVADPDVLRIRFAGRTGPHPGEDVVDVDAVLAEVLDRLAEVHLRRPRMITVDASGDVDAVVAAVARAVGG